jgi:4-diphosphocytidyl-2-C-methyl-D-erythritol kinase
LNFVLTKNDDVQILTNKDFVNTQDNLIYKVALFIKNRYKVKNSVAVKLQKNIPVAAGLGGGSSNCAVTITALSDLWELNLSEKEKHDIAAEFGSDINFFLTEGCAIGKGRGENITLIDPIQFDNIFLVNPGFEISSKEAYKILDLNANAKNGYDNLLLYQDSKYCYNRLENKICEKYPEIKEIINYLKDNGARNAILSGSGATVIGFCSDKETADNFSKYYSKKQYWNCITKTIRSSK